MYYAIVITRLGLEFHTCGRYQSGLSLNQRLPVDLDSESIFEAVVGWMEEVRMHNMEPAPLHKVQEIKG